MLGKKYQFTAAPNMRSSHTVITVTGAGFIFPLAFSLPLLFTGEFIHFRALLTGLFLISAISFLDDLKTVKPYVRMLVHLVAICLLLWQTGGLFNMKLWQLLPAFILVIGVINAYNFMDGINGILAGYSLVALGTIYYLKLHGFSRLPISELYLTMIAALITFSIFNFRKKALCFSGDTGSISIAFILSFLIIELMIQDDSSKWILLLAVYGIDAVGTILLRLKRKENILEPHRSHFYQFLANEKKIPHVLISLIYALAQIGFNIVLSTQPIEMVLAVFVFLITGYALARLSLEGKRKLFVDYAYKKQIH
jgi:UDP-N-acetylmuramyl pentapeptide phosphotransferase/UDP-N-acetylglucosamine-1-phosphate transferase